MSMLAALWDFGAGILFTALTSVHTIRHIPLSRLPSVILKGTLTIKMVYLTVRVQNYPVRRGIKAGCPIFIGRPAVSVGVTSIVTPSLTTH